jgi:hypothetical protein
MQGKILFVAGVAVGYVFGTRRGRQGYEKLKRQAGDVWSSPRVQKTVSDAQKLAKDNIPVVGEKISDAVDSLKKAAPATSAGASSTGSNSTETPAEDLPGNV